MYDRLCEKCGHIALDLWEPINIEIPPRCQESTQLAHAQKLVCAGKMERVMLPNTRAIIGDEIDVTIKHGLCNPDGSPKRYRSRAELHRAEQRAGMTNYVVHHGNEREGSDKSKHTTRWT